MRAESAKQVAIDVLRAAGEPLHTKEITKRVIDSGRSLGVVLEALRLRRQVVATGVGRDDPKTRRRERLELSAPPEPKLREAVQQGQDHRPDVSSEHVTNVGLIASKRRPNRAATLTSGTPVEDERHAADDEGPY
jgi:hypothetical protein